MTYELDPFVSPGEVAIKIPGLPIFFEETYRDAELAATAWAYWLLRWKPAVIESGSFAAILDTDYAPLGWDVG